MHLREAKRDTEPSLLSQQFIAIMVMLIAHSVQIVGSDSKYFFSHSPGKYNPALDDFWRIAIKVNIFGLNVLKNQTFCIKHFCLNIVGALRLCIKV